MRKERYVLEIGGAKAFLAPLTFAVADAALGKVFAAEPKYLSAGAIVINTLWVRGSAKLKQGGEDFDEACMQAFSAVESLEFNINEGEISVPYTSLDKNGKQVTKIYSCRIKERISRETLEECLGLIRPTLGAAKPLTAGLRILTENWIDGDKEIKDNEELLIAACTACYHLIKMKGATLKKL